MLEGRHAKLRIMDSTDLDSIRKLRNSPYVRESFIDRHLINDLQQQNFYRQVSENKNSIFLVVECINTSKFKGVFMIQGIDHRNQRAAIGHFYEPETDPLLIYEAGYLSNMYCFEYLNLHKLTSEILMINKKSIRYSESIGMTREGILTKHVFANGEFQDVAIYACFRNLYLLNPTPITSHIKKYYSQDVVN